MPAITTIDALVNKMRDLAEKSVGNLTAFAELCPSLFDAAPWAEMSVYDANTASSRPMTIAEYMRDTFGVGRDDDYISLPAKPLDAMLTAFKDAGVKPTDAELVALSGTSKATVNRAKGRVGLVDESKSDAIAAGRQGQMERDGQGRGTAAGTQGVSGETSASSANAETPEFNLPAMLSAMDDAELSGVLAVVGWDRIRSLAPVENLVTV